MATHKGNEGVIKIGSSSMAEVRSWSLNETAETIEDTVMGDSFRSYKLSMTAWDGSADVYWDETDTTGQGACTVGASLTVSFYPEGTASGASYYTGTAVVTQVSRTASFDGMVEASITFQGSGDLDFTTVGA